MTHAYSLEATRKTRVVIVHAHEVLRAGLNVLIDHQDDFEVVASFGSVSQALPAIPELRPDLFVTGCELTEGRSASSMAEMVKLAPGSRHIVLTHHDTENNVRSTLLAGVDALVDLESSWAEFTAAMRAVCAGRNFVCNTTATRILSSYVSNGSASRASSAIAASITEREREVLTRVALGCSNKTIARELGLSPKTVEKHRSNLMRKLQLHNAAAITMYAIRNGMTTSDPNRVPAQATGTHH